MADQEFYDMMKQKIEAVQASENSDSIKNPEMRKQSLHPTQKVSQTDILSIKKGDFYRSPSAATSMISSSRLEKVSSNGSSDQTFHRKNGVVQNPNSVPFVQNAGTPSLQSVPVGVPVSPNSGMGGSVVMPQNIYPQTFASPQQPIQSVPPMMNMPSVSNGFYSQPVMPPPPSAPMVPVSAGVKHYTSRTPVNPLQQSSSLLNAPQMPSHGMGSSGGMNSAKASTSMHSGFNPSVSQANMMTVNLFHIAVLGFMMIGMVFLAFFLGRWTFNTTPVQDSETITKKNILGLDESGKSYTIRVTSMPRVPYDVGRLNLKRAIQIKQKLFEAGYHEVEINRNGEDLVVDIGRFSDPQDEALLLTIKKLKQFKIRDRKAFTNIYATKIDG